MKKFVSSVMLVLFVVSILSVSFKIQTVNALGLYGTPETASNGRSFGVETKIGLGGINESGGYAMVATDNAEGVFVAWCSYEGANYLPVVYFACSHDDGKSWNTPMKLCGGGEIGAYEADIAVNQRNDYVYFVYISNITARNNVYLRRSIDGGISFSPPVMVNDVNGSEYDSVDIGLSYSIHVAVANDGTIYVVWKDNRTDASHSDIFLSKSTDGGQTFGTNIRVNPYQSGAYHGYPWITIDESGVVYIAYTEISSTTQNVFLTKSLDGGSTFKAPVKVNDDFINSYRGKKEIAISQDGKICMVWTDARNTGTTNWDIYFATSLDGGLSFSPNVRVNDDNGLSSQGIRSIQGTPSLAIDEEGGIHVVWKDFRDNQVNDFVTPGDERDVYYAFSKDGKQFSRNVKANYIPDAIIADCADPNVAIDSNDNLHVVWSDSPYNYSDNTIYYVFSAPLLSVKTKTVVGQGYNLLFNVTMLNAGYTNETFNVTALVNTTIIGTEANVNVVNGTLVTLPFAWNTTGLTYGNYTLNVFAGNASARSSIVVTIPGDINGDFRVNLSDLVALVFAYGSNSSSPNWNPNADINGNGSSVDLTNLVILTQHYGQHYP